MNITKQRLARIIAEEVSRHEKLVKQREVEKLIKEAVLQESVMKEIHTMIGDSVLFVLDSNAGIDGMGLIGLVRADLDGDEDFIMTRGPMGSVEKEEIFSVLDDLEADGQVWLDDQEDAWYIGGSPEAQAAQQAYVAR